MKFESSIELQLQRHELQPRLVEAGDELLVVVWYQSDIEDDRLQTFTLDVFKLVQGSDGVRSVKVDSLGDRVLLVGMNGTESLCTKGLMGSSLERNCVYYQMQKWTLKKIALEKFCLTDGRSQKIPIPTDSSYTPREVEWIVTQSW